MGNPNLISGGSGHGEVGGRYGVERDMTTAAITVRQQMYIAARGGELRRAEIVARNYHARSMP